MEEDNKKDGQNGENGKEGKGGKRGGRRPYRSPYIHEENASIWYGSGNAGIKSAANFSTAIVAGQANSIRLKVPNFIGSTMPKNGIDCTRITVPLGTIMTFKIDSTVPVTSVYNWTEHANSFNAATLKFYNILRGDKVTTTPFDAVDLGIYLVSIAEVFKVMRTIQRAMIYMNTVIPNTRYSPQLIYRALTGSSNYNQEKSAYANLQARFLKDTNLLYSLQFPKVGTILDKADWIYDYVYCDDTDLEKANLYAYVPKSVLKYEGYKTKTGGMLTRVQTPINNVNATLVSWFELYESLIAALLDDNDVRNISAWIKAKGFPVMIQGTIKPEALGKPIFNEEVLEQMMNVQTTTHVPNHYVQVNNLLVGESENSSFAAGTVGDPIIELGAFTDTVLDSKSPIAYERILTSTRFMPILKYCHTYQSVTLNGEDITLGTEGDYYSVVSDFYSCNSYDIMYIDGDGKVVNIDHLGSLGFRNAITKKRETGMLGGVIPFDYDIEDIWNGFEYRPAYTVVDITATRNSNNVITSIDSIEAVRRYGSWDYVIIINYDALERLNDLIVSAELGLI